MNPRLRALIHELSRRRVFRVAAAYLAVGLGVIYAGDAVLPRLGLENAQTVLVVLVILGFPLAVALAWAFDVTPEGVERTGPAATVASAGVSAAGPSQKSIVVLPFDNMSPDPQDGYLGDGLTEELTSKLSRLGSLRVISRTSAMQMKWSEKDLATLARELDIHYMLEGSVRKAGDALRVTAQLIDAVRDRHLWSESYAGTMEDVFGMQEKVALAIVDALRVELSPDEARRMEERPFQSFQAYQFYLQVRADALIANEASLDRALEIADRALAAVGENELLLSARGMVLFELVNAMLKPPALHAGFLEEARRCADRALVLDPSSPPARWVKGAVLFARGDVPSAMTEWAQALSVDPNHPDLLFVVGYFKAAGGWDLEGARDHLTKLERVDPLTPLHAGALAWVHWFEGDFDAAARRLQPWWSAVGEGNPWLILLAYYQAAAGDIPGAIKTVERVQAESPHHLLTRLAEFLVHAWRGERAEAIAAVSDDLKTAALWDDIWPLYLAAGYACVGELDRAFRWLDQALVHGITNVVYLRERDPFLANLRGDTRFDAALQKAARLAKQAAAAEAAFRADRSHSP